MIEAPKIGDDGRLEAARMSRAELMGYIEPRLEEIFELISVRLSRSGLGGRMPRRAVLTGGASDMPGMRELASRVLAMPVRLGRPTAAAQLGEDCHRPTFSSAAGLLTFDHSKGGDPKAGASKAQAPSGPSGDNGLMGRAFDWLKENF
jgi:cell division protein FtsA